MIARITLSSDPKPLIHFVGIINYKEMTSREALELCEILTDLNYDGQQTLLKPELFAKPNFPLVYNILHWLSLILSSNSTTDSIDKSRKSPQQLSTLSETDIIVALTDFGKLFYAELGLRLNLISLYEADYSSCPQLLKVARPLYEAARQLAKPSHSKSGTKSDSSSSSSPNLLEVTKRALDEIVSDSQNKNSDRQSIEATYLEAREIGSQIEQMLAKEKSQYERERFRVMETRFDPAEIERILKSTQLEIEEESKRLAKSNGDLTKDCSKLDEKLDAKEREIQSAEDKLSELLMKAPNYVDQYEKLHKEYEQAYDDNVAKYRNFIHLESCVYSLKNNGDDLGWDLSNQLADDDDGCTFGGEGAAAAGADSLAPRAGGLLTSERTGPAKLLESLLDGASKPMSTSTGAAGAAVDAAATGTRYRYTGRLATDGAPSMLGDNGSLELEGLLMEFVADTTGDNAGGAGAGAEADDDDDEDDDDDNDDDEEGDDDDGDGAATG